MSFNRKDWLKLAGLLGLGATGLGAAGIGPLAGLLGGGMAGGAAATAGGVPVGAIMGASEAATTLPASTGLLGGAGKGLKALQMANSFVQQSQPQQAQVAPMPRAQSAPAQSNQELAELMKRIYGGLYV